MAARPYSAERLDVARFAEAGATIEGHITLTDLPRLAACLAPEKSPETSAAAAKGPVAEWLARGERRGRTGPEHWLHLRAHADVPLTCQRCLGVVVEAVDVARAFRFVADEAAAEALDAEIDEDVLVLSTRFDLRHLIEDELLLHLPLVPRHEVCPADAPAPLARAGDAISLPEQQAESPLAEHPFAALAVLRKPGDA
jgi:uncharacterized protein